MCGIMGYIGAEPAKEILLDGLERLSYRGYDSAGVATLDESGLHIVKVKGRVEALRKKCAGASLPGTMGIGHTRWATHGAVNEKNAHPQTDQTGQIAVAHNGVIENYQSLKSELKARGHALLSDTDTEAAAHLIGLLYEGDMKEALLRAATFLTGSYALAVACAREPEALFCVRSGSPLVLGMGESGAYMASDIPALLPYTRDVTVLEDGEAAVLRRDGITIYGADGAPVSRAPFHVSWDAVSAEKGGYAHYMLKEIFEQPQTLSRPPACPEPPRRAPGEIALLGCGTAYHAGLLGAYYMEKLARIPARAYIASEYRCAQPFPYRDAVAVAISQSGETSDTLTAARLARERGARVLALTNTIGSSLQRMSDDAIFTLAGPELAVASTKAYTAQCSSLLWLALCYAELSGAMAEGALCAARGQIAALAPLAQETLALSDAIARYAAARAAQDLFLFIGRGMDAVTAREGALKFKEITYIPAQGVPAGELKHGTIALVRDHTPVLAVCTQPEWLDKTLLSLTECRARGADTACVCPRSMRAQAEAAADTVFCLPDCPPLTAPILSVLPLQLLAYHAACAKKLDVDKPRNLAKSVTVE